MPRLSIITLSLVERRLRRRILFKHLHDQIEAAGGTSVVEHLVYEDHGEMPNGVKLRNAYREATGDYICCLDDDDFIAPSYVKEILNATSSDPDVVTFNLSHAYKNQLWKFRVGAGDHAFNSPGDYEMSANHLCAWRADIAKRIPWLPMYYGVDQLWYKLLHAAYPSVTECHIDEVLYNYVYRPHLTQAQKMDKINASYEFYAGGVDGWKDFKTGFICSSIAGRNGPEDTKGLVMFHDGSVGKHDDRSTHLGTFHVR